MLEYSALQNVRPTLLHCPWCSRTVVLQYVYVLVGKEEYFVVYEVMEQPSICNTKKECQCHKNYVLKLSTSHEFLMSFDGLFKRSKITFLDSFKAMQKIGINVNLG